MISRRLLGELNVRVRDEMTPKALAKCLRSPKVGLRCPGRRSLWVSASRESMGDDNADRRCRKPTVWRSEHGWIEVTRLASLVTRSRNLLERGVTLGSPTASVQGSLVALTHGEKGGNDAFQERELRKDPQAASQALADIRRARQEPLRHARRKGSAPLLP